MHRPVTTSLLAVFSAGLLFMAAPSQAAQTVQTSDYIAISFEIEDYDSIGSRWVVTNSSTPAQANDPDGNHSDQASGNEYLEVLPDYRVTHADAFHPSGSLWGAGNGPELTYNINFPEAGRYYFHLLSYSTGSEDNGAHVGLNDTWAAEGANVQWCRGKHAWTWSSAKRDSAGMGSCGAEKTIWLDVPTAGNHVVYVNAREDGVELDRAVMIKDKSNNTRVCEPVGATQITCKDGSIEAADDLVDLRVTATSTASEVVVGGTATLEMIVENLDNFDHATNIEVVVELDNDMVFLNASSSCSHAAGVVTCTHNDLEPTAPDEWEEFDINVRVDAAGQLTASASISSDQEEEFTANDTSTVNVSGVGELVNVDLVLVVTASAQTANVNDLRRIKLSLVNSDASDSNDVTITYTPDPGSGVGELPTECAGRKPVVCALGIFAAGESKEIEIPVFVYDAGTQVHSATVVSNNESDAANNTASVEIEVIDPDAPETEPEPETPETTAGETTGGETPSGETTAGGTAGGETTSGETTAGETTGGESTAGETTGDETTNGETTAVETTGGESIAGETTGGELAGGADTAGEPDSGEDASGVTTGVESGGVTGGTAQANAGNGGGAFGLFGLLFLLFIPLVRRVSSERAASALCVKQLS